MDDIKVELLEDTGVVEGKDGLQHNVKLLSVWFVSPVNKFHSKQVFLIQYANSKGMDIHEAAIRIHSRAKARYETIVRDIKYGKGEQ